MKRGPIILVFIGLVLVVGLYFSPKSPKLAKEEVEAVETTSEENNVDAKVDDAILKMESGELPPMQAVLTIRDIAEEHPENVKAQFTLGVMSMQTGQYEKAIERFQKVIAIDENQFEAHRWLGKAHLALSDTLASKNAYSKALNLANDEIRAELEAEMAQLKLTN